MNVVWGAMVLVLACIGNAELWVVLINRRHSLKYRHKTLRRVRYLHDAGLLLFPPVVISTAGLRENGLLLGGTFLQQPLVVQGLLAVAGLGLIPFVASVILWQTQGRTARLQQTTSRTYDVLAEAHPGADRHLVLGDTTSLLSRMPGNQIYQLEVNCKTLLLNRPKPARRLLAGTQVGRLTQSLGRRTGRWSNSLPATPGTAETSPQTRSTATVTAAPLAIGTLKLAHFSDVHLVGCPGRGFHQFVTEQLCRMQPDAFVFTGDLVDEAELFPWAIEMFQRLLEVAPGFFILGNHDWHLDHQAMRTELAATGWTDLGEKSTRLTLKDWNLLIAGTEAPWLGENPAVPERDEEHLRLLLSHSPDQRDYAVANNFDLMLAGHNHGGQVVLPVVGPVYSPSQFGVRYSGGVYEHRNLLMHVSRGSGAMDPVRLNCRPEITLLQLQLANEMSTFDSNPQEDSGV